MFERKYAPYIGGAVVGTFMSFIMSAIITAANTGLNDGFFGRWMQAFFIAWLCAVPLAIAAQFFMPKLMKKLIRQQ